MKLDKPLFLTKKNHQQKNYHLKLILDLGMLINALKDLKEKVTLQLLEYIGISSRGHVRKAGV